MLIKHILPAIYSHFFSNGELFFTHKESQELLILKEDLLKVVGKSPFTSTYDTIYGFSMVSIVENLIVSQSYEAIMNGNSTINEIIIFELKDSSIKLKYKENILMSDILINKSKLVASFTDSTSYDKAYCVYDFIERDKNVLVTKKKESKSYLRTTNHPMYFMIIDKHFNINWVDVATNKVCFELNIGKYIVSSPLITNGDSFLENQVEKVLYCKKNEIIVVFLKPYKLLGISSRNGQVLWSLDYPLNSNQIFVDEESGLLYIVESYFTGHQRANVVRCNVINTKYGELKLERDLDYFDIYAGKEGISSSLCFAGLYKDYFYFSFFNGEIFKLKKETANIVERYKHERPFYAPPQIEGNRLFVLEDTDSHKNQQSLLIFEL